MPEISARAAEMPSSPIRKLAEFAVEAERKGVSVHYLNIGQPDVATPEAFWASVATSTVETLKYSHSAGIHELRVAAAEHYRGRGLPVDPADILVTTGGSEATLFAFLACFDPGDEVIVVEPFYANYLGFAKIAGVELIPLTTKIEEDFRLPSVEAIESTITPKTKGILLCNPSNPTGTVFSPETLEKVSEICLERDLFLILDEVYRDFYYGEERLLSVMEIPGMEEHGIMLDSVSKKFSLCGARVGFFVTKNREVIANVLKMGQARLCPPTLDQLGVTACLRHTPQSYFLEVREEYISRRDLLVSRLSSIEGVVCPRIDGAFYAVVELPVDDADRFCEWMVREFSYEGETVLLAPASGFYATPGLGTKEVRIAYVLDKSLLARAMDVLEHALSAYPDRTSLTDRSNFATIGV